jgi:hypothetical protein
MLTPSLTRWIAAVALVLTGTRAWCQSQSDLAAFNAMIVAPFGALPPVADDNGRPVPDAESVSMSYGRWRYNIDDAIHHNVGGTLAHRIGGSATSLSITGAFLSLSCDCAGWTSAGVSMKSRLLSTRFAGGTTSYAAGHADLELTAGGARYAGDGHASGYATAASLDLGASVRMHGGSRFAVSIVPGIGLGHFSSADLADGGFRPLMGAAIGWRSSRALSIDFGVRRVFLSGGPTQVGATVSLRRN